MLNHSVVEEQLSKHHESNNYQAGFFIQRAWEITRKQLMHTVHEGGMGNISHRHNCIKEPGPLIPQPGERLQNQPQVQPALSGLKCTLSVTSQSPCVTDGFMPRVSYFPGNKKNNVYM